jgi:hypothetical protein
MVLKMDTFGFYRVGIFSLKAGFEKNEITLVRYFGHFSNAN